MLCGTRDHSKVQAFQVCGVAVGVVPLATPDNFNALQVPAIRKGRQLSITPCTTPTDRAATWPPQISSEYGSLPRVITKGARDPELLS